MPIPSAARPLAGGTRSGALLIVTILAVAVNMRPTITSVGPVLDRIGADAGLGPAALGTLGSLPVLAFAAMSPLVSALAARVGSDRTVLLALGTLILATVLRSLPGGAVSLFAGTIVIGAAIAVLNVLLPAFVRADFPDRLAVATGTYSSALGASAALASGLALPIAQAAGWRIALGAWAALAVLGGVVWSARRRRGSAASPTREAAAGGARVWRSATAWQVALFMGAQSTVFYLLIAWLPTLERRIGVAPVTAGWHLFGFQAAGIVAGLAITAGMHGRGDLRVPALAVSGGMALGMLGLLLAPDATLGWVLIAGVSSGASLVVALTLIGQRAASSADAARLSGMVQSVGYLIAASGPIGAGVLLDRTGAWQAVVIAVVAVAALQCIPAYLAGRDRSVR